LVSLKERDYEFKSLVEYIHRVTGIDKETIIKILEAQEDYYLLKLETLLT